MVEQDYEKALDGMKQDIHELRAAFTRWAKENGQRRINDRVEAVKDRVRERVEQGMGRVREGMEHGMGWARSRWDDAHDQSRQAVEKTREQMKAHPWLSVTGALLLGAIIDRLLLRR